VDVPGVTIFCLCAAADGPRWTWDVAVPQAAGGLRTCPTTLPTTTLHRAPNHTPARTHHNASFYHSWRGAARRSSMRSAHKHRKSLQIDMPHTALIYPSDIQNTGDRTTHGVPDQHMVEKNGFRCLSCTKFRQCHGHWHTISGRLLLHALLDAIKRSSLAVAPASMGSFCLTLWFTKRPYTFFTHPAGRALPGFYATGHRR